MLYSDYQQLKRFFYLFWFQDSLAPAAEVVAASHQAQQPTLYLHGSLDGCIGVELVRGAERHLAPGSRMIVVEGAGHFPQLEQPEESTSTSSLGPPVRLLPLGHRPRECVLSVRPGRVRGSGLRRGRGRGGGAGAAFAGGGGAGWLGAHVVADAGHDVAEVVQVVVGQGVEQQAAGDLDVAG